MKPSCSRRRVQPRWASIASSLCALCLLVVPFELRAQKRASTPQQTGSAVQVQGVVVDASVSDTVVELGDVFEYTLEVRSPTNKEARVLEEPDFRPFSVMGRRQGMQSMFRGNVSERIVTVVYRLRTRRLGDSIEIAPPVVLIDREKYSPKPIKIKVVKKGEAPRKTRKRGSDDAVYVDTSISLDRDPYVGEQIVLEYDLMINPRKIEAQPNPPSEPKLDAFWIEELNDRAMGSRAITRIDGQYFEKILLRRYAIYPLEPGEAVVDAMTVPLIKGGFMQAREEIEVQSKPITFQVKPLPPDAPEGFEEGNVGDWDFLVTSDSLRTRVGRSVQINISAEGTGLANRIELPGLESTEMFRVGESDQNIDQRTQGGQIISKKSVRYALTPLKEGTIELPSFAFTYFEPDSGEYRTKTSPAIKIEVSAGELPPELEQRPEPVSRDRASEQDIMSALKSELAAIDPRVEPGDEGSAHFQESWWFKLLTALSFLLMLGVLSRPLVARLFRPDSPTRRRAALHRRSQRLLEEARAEQDADRIIEAIKLYCAEALGVLKGHLTPGELPRRLERLGLEREVADELGEVLRESQSIRYGRSRHGEGEDEAHADVGKLAKRASGALKSLHEQAVVVLRDRPLKSAAKAGIVLCGLLVLSGGLAAPKVAHAQVVAQPDLLGRAVEAHESHEWEVAVERWRELEEAHPRNASILHALGVACLQASDFGCGLLALERASLLRPRDRSITKNLDVARQMRRVKAIEALRGRSQVLAGEDDFFWWDIARKVDPALMAILLLMSIWVVIAVALVRPRVEDGVKRDLMGLIGVLALLMVLGSSGAWLFRAEVMAETTPVVLLTTDVTFRDGPSEHAAERRLNSPIVAGMRFVQEEARQGWVKLRLPDDSSGWIEASRVGDVTSVLD